MFYEVMLTRRRLWVHVLYENVVLYFMSSDFMRVCCLIVYDSMFYESIFPFRSSFHASWEFVALHIISSCFVRVWCLMLVYEFMFYESMLPCRRWWVRVLWEYVALLEKKETKQKDKKKGSGKNR